MVKENDDKLRYNSDNNLNSINGKSIKQKSKKVNNVAKEVDKFLKKINDDLKNIKANPNILLDSSNGSLEWSSKKRLKKIKKAKVYFKRNAPLVEFKPLSDEIKRVRDVFESLESYYTDKKSLIGLEKDLNKFYPGKKVNIDLINEDIFKISKFISNYKADENLNKSFSMLKKDIKLCLNLKGLYLNKDLKDLIILIFEQLNYLLDNQIFLEKNDVSDSIILEILNHLNESINIIYCEGQYCMKRNSQSNVKDVKEVVKEREHYISKFLRKLKEINKERDCEKIIKEIESIINKKLSPLYKELMNLIFLPKKEMTSIIFKDLSKQIILFYDLIIEILNKISYLDSLLNQLKSETYDIESHLFNEISVRYKIHNYLNENKNKIDAGSISIYFIAINDKESIEYFKNKINCNKHELDKLNNLRTFTEIEEKENSHKIKLLNHLKDLQRSLQLGDKKSNKKIRDKLAESYKILGKKLYAKLNLSKITEEKLKEFFDSELFFNSNNYYILLSDSKQNDLEINFDIISTQKDFIAKVIPLFIFHKTKSKTFYKILNSIIEPHFLSHINFFNFLSGYNTARKESKNICLNFLKQQKSQNDISEDDFNQIKYFMELGYKLLENAQKSIVNQKSKLKQNKFDNPLIDRPYLVHSLMMDILKIAVFSEGRVKYNFKKEPIYTGRETGFEGGNTVAVHGANNYLKYEAMLNLIKKYFNYERKNFFDEIEEFKIWLAMAWHDAATYDSQNVIEFSKQKKLGYNNKGAHNLIASTILKENKIIKKVFNNKTKEGAITINQLSLIIRNHDFNKICLDIPYLIDYVFKENFIDDFDSKPDPNKEIRKWQFVKSFVCQSLSGIADNSAGIAFSDYKTNEIKVKVDPWEEKGSTILTAGKGISPESFFRILAGVIKSDNYFDKNKEKIKEELNNLIEEEKNDVKKERLKNNFKLLSKYTFISIAGVITSGIMRFFSFSPPESKQYAPPSLKVNFIFDYELLDIFYHNLKKLGVKEEDIIKKCIYRRIFRFLNAYKDDKHKDKNLIKGNLLNQIQMLHKGKSTRIQIYNSDIYGKKLNTIGLELIFHNFSDISKYIFKENYSINFVNKIKKYGKRDFKK
ncbi:MAG: hypothetical protein ACTSW3_00595 [Promethearchaeota archaeon]